MCGIAGIVNSKLERDDFGARLSRMQEQMHHRGPDDRGIFVSRDARTGLVSTRLAILDLSQAGHQPMQTPDGRFHIAFNGEIYNFDNLRADLAAEGEEFVSHSDTEVILKMYARYGPDCVREFEGMFAVAIWNEQEQTCFLARDPLGIKSLYYCEQNGGLIFGSEIRTLLMSGLVPREKSSEAIAGYLLFGAVPEPDTMVRGVKALPAGHYLIWSKGVLKPRKYWDIQFQVGSHVEEDRAKLARKALEESIDRHFVSDVPVGVFLSGGIDSTCLTALASKKLGADLHTFSISFDNRELNEGDVAARTAKHFGTKHIDWRLDSVSAKSLLQKFLESSDQPSIDGFNSFCVSKLAHDHGFKVVLSGLGSDELFGGYGSFELMPRMLRTSRALNLLSPLRKSAGRVLESTATSPRMRRLGHFFTGPPTTADAYWAMRGTFTPREVALLLSRYYRNDKIDVEQLLHVHVPDQPTLGDEVSYLELTRYMRNQLLRDSDVMSMAWSLELRVPFVDRKFLETIAKIPAEQRLTQGKRLLLEAVPEIPEWVRNRPKQGFVFPFKDWITAEWRDVFQRIEQESPVPLKNWFRCWCLFALDSFLRREGMQSTPS